MDLFHSFFTLPVIGFIVASVIKLDSTSAITLAQAHCIEVVMYIVSNTYQYCHFKQIDHLPQELVNT